MKPPKEVIYLMQYKTQLNHLVDSKKMSSVVPDGEKAMYIFNDFFSFYALAIHHFYFSKNWPFSNFELPIPATYHT